MSYFRSAGPHGLAHLLSRRSFLGGVAAQVGIAPIGAWVAGLADGSTARAQTVRIRPEVHTDAGRRMLGIYREAIGRMRSTTYPSYHPFAWSFQANIHGVPDDGNLETAFRQRPGHDQQVIQRWRRVALGTGNAGLDNPDRVWRTCTHGDVQTGRGHPDFLPWHRLYLAYFEEIVARVADREFALPYWNYLDTRLRRLPPEFAAPRVGSETNWLHASDRSQNFRDNGLTEQDVPALRRTAIDQLFREAVFLPTARRRGFNTTLEMDLHGLIHVAIGGDSGGMSGTATAARDPIFWIHHATVDWIWESWRHPAGAHMPSRDPSDAAWLDRRFRFVDARMTPVDQNGPRHALRAEQNLRYRYDRLHPVSAPAVGAGPEVAGLPTTVQTAGGSVTRSAGDATRRTGDTMRKAGDSVTIELKPSVSEGVARGLAASPSTRWLLVLRIRAREEPGVYRVYVAKEGVADPGVQIGAFGLFGVSHGGHAGHGPASAGDVLRELEVSEFVADGTINPTKLGRLTVRAFHTNKQVSVTIVGAELVGR